MRTPIADFINSYTDDKVRLHMPGHKGVGAPSDITEMDGADVLYAPKGIIAESERNASCLFGSAQTIYSTEGSSLSIRAVIYLVKMYACVSGLKPTILATRNVHSSFISACALVDVEPVWLYGDSSDIISSRISSEELEDAIEKYNPVALYITSPDYLGNTADIKKLSEISKKHGVLLVVDNAHGAYLKFIPESAHPLDLGADITVDSAHKTLPCLTGTGYLHIAKTAPSYFKENANRAMSLFASTSPSYLLLKSLDEFNSIAETFKTKLRESINALDQLKSTIAKHGYALVGNEPQKLTVRTKYYGYHGTELADILKKQNIYAEFADKDYLTVMFSPYNSADDFIKLEKALLSVPKKQAISSEPPLPVRAEKAMSIRSAVFSTTEEIPVAEAEGRILARLTCSCPPAVPIAVSGEIISKKSVEALNYYGFETVSVVKR